LTSTGTFVVRPEASRAITPADSDVVVEVMATHGTRLAAGAPVVRLVDYTVERALAQAARTADSLSTAERIARADGRVAEAEALVASHEAAEAQRIALARRSSRLTLRAPIGGVIANMRPEELVGRQVLPGDSLLAVVALDTVEISVALRGAGAARVRQGQVVHLVSYADPASRRVARVEGVSAAGLRSIIGQGVVEARVRIAWDSAWRPGMRGEASVELERSTLAAVRWWKVRQWLRTDLWL
jgi:multidrug resistance efflux pump